MAVSPNGNLFCNCHRHFEGCWRDGGNCCKLHLQYTFVFCPASYLSFLKDQWRVFTAGRKGGGGDGTPLFSDRSADVFTAALSKRINTGQICFHFIFLFIHGSPRRSRPRNFILTNPPQKNTYSNAYKSQRGAVYARVTDKYVYYRHAFSWN